MNIVMDNRINIFYLLNNNQYEQAVNLIDNEPTLLDRISEQIVNRTFTQPEKLPNLTSRLTQITLPDDVYSRFINALKSAGMMSTEIEEITETQPIQITTLFSAIANENKTAAFKIIENFYLSVGADGSQTGVSRRHLKNEIFETADPETFICSYTTPMWGILETLTKEESSKLLLWLCTIKKPSCNILEAMILLVGNRKADFSDENQDKKNCMDIYLEAGNNFVDLVSVIPDTVLNPITDTIISADEDLVMATPSADLTLAFYDGNVRIKYLALPNQSHLKGTALAALAQYYNDLWYDYPDMPKNFETDRLFDALHNMTDFQKETFFKYLSRSLRDSVIRRYLQLHPDLNLDTYKTHLSSLQALELFQEDTPSKSTIRKSYTGATDNLTKGLQLARFHKFYSKTFFTFPGIQVTAANSNNPIEMELKNHFKEVEMKLGYIRSFQLFLPIKERDDLKPIQNYLATLKATLEALNNLRGKSLKTEIAALKTMVNIEEFDQSEWMLALKTHFEDITQLPDFFDWDELIAFYKNQSAGMESPISERIKFVDEANELTDEDTILKTVWPNECNEKKNLVND